MCKSNLELLVDALGWQGGTIHQVVDEIKRLKSLEKRTPQVPVICGVSNCVNNRDGCQKTEKINIQCYDKEAVCEDYQTEI